MWQQLPDRVCSEQFLSTDKAMQTPTTLFRLYINVAYQAFTKNLLTKVGRHRIKHPV